MSDERDEIRARIDIVELVGQTVALKRAGKNWKGLCPFHQDRNPSLDVNPNIGRYTCWSCGERGDIFTWVEKTQNVPFAEALQILAKQAGVQLKSRSAADQSSRVAQKNAMEAAHVFFKEQLLKSSTARAYCEGRGLDESVQREWELGFAPNVGEALAIYLKKANFKLQECKDLFLVDGDETIGYHDKFRNRLMFPIRDDRGEIVGFGGRAIGDVQPKYINSSDTPLYKKSRVLYAFYKAKEAIRAENQAVLVEGYLDVIACHRAGVKTAVASLGTALSEEHAKLLKRWCDTVVILYDRDAAGEKATHRAAEILSAEGLKIRVALMPQGDDPDTLLRKEGGAAAVMRVVQAPLSQTDFKIKALEARLAPIEEDFWREAAEIVAGAPNEMERLKYIEHIAGLNPHTRDFQEARKAFTKMVNAAAARKRAAIQTHSSPRPQPMQHPGDELPHLEAAMFKGVFDESLRAQIWDAATDPSLFTTRTGSNFAQALKDAFPSAPPRGKPAEWLHELPEAFGILASDIDAIAHILVNEQVLTDVVARLRDKVARRERRALRSDKYDDDRLKHFQTELSKLKGG